MKSWIHRKIGLHLTAKNSFDKTMLLLFQQFQSSLESEVDSYKVELEVVKHYTNSDVISSYQHLLVPLIIERESDYETSIGVDLGCWLGLSTFMLSTLGAKKIIGLDVNEKFIQTANFLKEHSNGKKVDFSLIEQGQLGELPIESSSVDWVLANDSFSNALPSQHQSMIQEVYRILKPGGTFYFSDNNNTRHAQTAKRLKKTYYEYEIGDGSLDHPDGSYFRLRRNIISAKHGITDPELLNRLSKATTYLWGNEIISTSSALLQNTDLVTDSNSFEPDILRVPIHPSTGSSIGAVTDPIKFVDIIFEAGFIKSDMYFSPNSEKPESIEVDNLEKSGRFYLISQK